MKFKVDGEVFDSSAEAYDYCIEEDIPLDHIEEVEEEDLAIEETEENPSKEGSVLEEDLQILDEEMTELEEAVEDYLDLPEEDRSIILEEVLPSKKQLKPVVKTRELLERLGSDFLERLNDDTSYVCPVCRKDLKALSGMNKENLAVSPKWEKYKHMRDHHSEFLKALLEIFGIAKSERKYDDMPRDDSESCSELESLSREELAEEISSDEELRRQFFRKWKEQLEKGE